MVVYSSNETKHFKFKVGRYDTDEIDSELLKNEMTKNNYDLIRIRTSVQDEFAIVKLHQTGFDAFFNAGIRRYKVNVWDNPLPSFLNPDTVFELYESKKEQVEDFRNILEETWGDYPLCYYRTPFLADRIDKKLEFDALFDYYSRNYDNNSNTKNFLWLMRNNNELVGFIALNVIREKRAVDSTIAGICINHQKNGYFIDVLRHIRGFCRENDLDYFMCGARMENYRSQRAFEKEHMACYKMEYIFHLIGPSLSS